MSRERNKHKHTHTHVCVCVQFCVHKHAYIHDTYIHHVYTHTYIHDVRIYIAIHTYTCIEDAYIHTHIDTYTLTHIINIPWICQRRLDRPPASVSNVLYEQIYTDTSPQTYEEVSYEEQDTCELVHEH